jgi:hypothetical protein
MIHLDVVKDGKSMKGKGGAISSDLVSTRSDELTLPVVSDLVTLDQDVALQENDLSTHVKTLVLGPGRGGGSEVVVLERRRES